MLPLTPDKKTQVPHTSGRGGSIGGQPSFARWALVRSKITSIPGAIVGGLIIGMGEALFEFFVSSPSLGGALFGFTFSATENWFAYVLALMFLGFRPQGLFGEKIIERV